MATSKNVRVMAIDPGVMTGYCYAEITENGNVLYCPFQVVDDVDECFNRLTQFAPRYVVIEDFEYRNRARSGLNLFPAQLIGITRLYTMGGSTQCAIYLQKASQGKSYYTDAVLKQLGLYKRGLPHGMDASRHLLQWCTFGAGNQYISSKDRKFAQLVEMGHFTNP